MLKPGDAVLVVGSGPIRIGQGCEFDYSCTQACRALRSEGMRVVLVNPNPATIMTDPGTADAIYLEPLDPKIVAQIIEKERPAAILATMGGQEGLNLALALFESGVLSAFGVELLGISPKTIEVAEDREQFKNLLLAEGLRAIPGCVVTSDLARDPVAFDRLIADIPYPLIIRASFTLGGGGGAIVENPQELQKKVAEALEASQGRPITIERSIVGWREFELEVMSDDLGTFVVVAAVENINPMGVHTGDSVTVVPTFTLRDRELQQMREAARTIFKALKMRIGGANIQFAFHPTTGEMVVVEMNPRVSRSSALVSKATGYPIAYISTKLALGHRLDTLTNELTGKTTAAYEPVIDYVGVKIPRFDFEKVAPLGGQLGVSMRSVGEVLAFGSSLAEAFTKGWRSLECGFDGFPDFEEWSARFPQSVHLAQSVAPNVATLPLVKTHLQSGASPEDVSKATGISSFFVLELQRLFEDEKRVQSKDQVTAVRRQAAKNLMAAGYARAWFDRKLGLVRAQELLDHEGVVPKICYRLVDSCAAEFAARTPYFFSTRHDVRNENRIDSRRKKVVILGSGPNRIGQGIEFDYACVHAVQTLKTMGYQAIMVNANPETVSTDYLKADKLYVEPIDDDAVSAILDAERPMGVVLQFGGQSPLKLARSIDQKGGTILGTSLATIDLCENRESFEGVLADLRIPSPRSASFGRKEDVVRAIGGLVFPLLVRPSYVIGGQGMTIVQDNEQLAAALHRLVDVSYENPVIVQEFLVDGIEYDVDLLCDGERSVIVGVLRHLDPPGIHSGDSVSEWIAPHEYDRFGLRSLLTLCERLANHVGARGLINVQCVLVGEKVYVIEANPRCSRTVPFLAKVQHRYSPYPPGQGMVAAATRIAMGSSLDELATSGWSWLTKRSDGLLGMDSSREPSNLFAFKFPVFPYGKFERLTTGPGPEMHSLGEVVGLSTDRVQAFYKGSLAAGFRYPDWGVAHETCGSAPSPFVIWIDSEGSAERLAPCIGELEYALRRVGRTPRLAVGGLPAGSEDALLALDYLSLMTSETQLRGRVAAAIGRGTPTVFSFESAALLMGSIRVSIVLALDGRHGNLRIARM
jgi:carbamoyl-phosphate synthase large subunit